MKVPPHKMKTIKFQTSPLPYDPPFESHLQLLINGKKYYQYQKSVDVGSDLEKSSDLKYSDNIRKDSLIMDTILQEDLITSKEIKDLCKRKEKLQDIWNNRPEGLTFPQEYLDLKQNNMEIEKEIDILNKEIESLFQKKKDNYEKAAVILRDFTKDKTLEELAQYIEPNRIYLSQEEILISKAGKKLNYKFIPAHIRDLN